jgi:hypothetical protein
LLAIVSASSITLREMVRLYLKRRAGLVSSHSMAAPIATNDTICDGEIEKIQEQSSCRGFGQTIVLRNFLRNGESLQNSCREEGQPRLFILWRV